MQIFFVELESFYKVTFIPVNYVQPYLSSFHTQRFKKCINNANKYK